MYGENQSPLIQANAQAQPPIVQYTVDSNPSVSAMFSTALLYQSSLLFRSPQLSPLGKHTLSTNATGLTTGDYFGLAFIAVVPVEGSVEVPISNSPSSCLSSSPTTHAPTSTTDSLPRSAKKVGYWSHCGNVSGWRWTPRAHRADSGSEM